MSLWKSGGSDMRWRVLITNGIVLAGIGWMVAMGTSKEEAKVLPPLRSTAEFKATDISALETNASFSPTRENVAALAVAYLERDQPGLASAVIEKAPAEVRSRPEVAHLHARALFLRGRPREALTTAKEALDGCASADAGASRCPSWLVAKTARQVAFFHEVVDAGIEDPVADPAGTKAAYERSAREVRLVAMR